MARRGAEGHQEVVRGRRRRHSRRRRREGGAAGCDTVLHLAALIGDSVFLPRAGELRRHQHRRHAECRAGGTRPAARKRSCIRRPAKSTAPRNSCRSRKIIRLHAQSPYAATKIAADQIGALVPCRLRYAGRGGAALQHLWSAPIGACRHPNRHRSARRRRPGVARRAASDARLQFVSDTVAGLIAVADNPRQCRSGGQPRQRIRDLDRRCRQADRIAHG